MAAPPALLEAAVATLLPGDETWPAAGELDLVDDVLAIAALAPGRVEAIEALLAALPADFADRGPDDREAALRHLEATAPDLFAALLVPAFDAYYTHAQVLALVEARSGYPVRAAQPEGHALPPFDEAVLALARTRAPLWREAP